ncbi:MAG: leucine-rich repeat domain-containing protein [Bacteroidales bacterium]|nr:leucine-rich repeat domain-containing protein [Bacteroidales bacterium]
MKLNFELNKKQDGLIVTGGEDIANELTIPSAQEFKGVMYPVIAIGDEAFARQTQLRQVCIPESVMKIGKMAFAFCELNHITIPESVLEIGDGAFYACDSMESLHIPKSVTKIGYNVFSSEKGLFISVAEDNNVYDSRENCNAIIETATSTLIQGCSSTIIPSTITQIGYQAFCCCTNLEEIIIPNSVTKIGKMAFHACPDLCNLVIPDSVTEIGDDAFGGCFSLKSIFIPKSVTKIGDGAFTGTNNLSSIIVSEDNPIYDSREDCNALIETATNTLLWGCNNTIIPNTVTRIRAMAFYECTGLTSIEIPNSVETIEENTFYMCEKLQHVIISDSVETIEEDAFYGCSSLTEIVIPESVKKIGFGAFMACRNLKEIFINDASLLNGIGLRSDIKITNKKESIFNLTQAIQQHKEHETEHFVANGNKERAFLRIVKRLVRIIFREN